MKKIEILHNDNLEYVKCNLCGADDFKLIIPWGSSNVVKCKNCGLIYRNLRITSAKVIKGSDVNILAIPTPVKIFYQG